MKMRVMVDNISCECEVSKSAWVRTFVSILLHPENPEKWYRLKVTHIKGNPDYENWDAMLIHPKDLDWKAVREKEFENWYAGFQKQSFLPLTR